MSASGRLVFSAWGSLEANLRDMVGNGPGRRVIVDRQSGIIVVRALPEQLQEVSDYLRSTEATVTRQVLLEAKIVEVDLDHAYQAGIDWVKVLQLGASHYFIGQGTPPNGFGTAAALTPTNSPVTIAPGNPINGFATNTLGGAFTLAANLTDFNAFKGDALGGGGAFVLWLFVGLLQRSMRHRA